MTEQAFNDIAITERRRLIEMARRLLQDQEEAADAAQEALVCLWLFRERVDAEQSVPALLTTMLRNICFMRLRKKKGRPPHIGLQSIPTSHLKVTVSASGNPQQILEARERAETVKEALGQLPVRYQTLLKMHYSIGLSIQQIANIQDTTTAAVKQMLLRARNALKCEIERRDL